MAYVDPKENDTNQRETNSHAEEDLQKILNGQHVPVDYITVGLDRIGNFVPKTKKTVYYIVGAILINDAGQILMIQEAKYSCYGQWYLPMGRVEREESFLEAVKREVEEEAGLTFEPTTLLCVEYGSGYYYRLTFTGHVTGGKLKTLEQKDKESLQAEWIDPVHIQNKLLPIRAKDILSLIQIGYKYWERTSEQRHRPWLPLPNKHKHIINRPLIVQKNSNSEIYVLTSSEGGVHFPCGVDFSRTPSALLTAFFILKEALGNTKNLRPRICGLVNLEYGGEPGSKEDGICFSILVSLDAPALPQIENSVFKWTQLTDPTLVENICLLFKEGKAVPFIDLHAGKS
ncbi:8-oxo-dGDP phosphatase NUDT18-like isoform X2 [Crassostrea virginica]|uniref:8-oxo-dGDP phosphatase NUDT18-like isoform X2 n=1 Tax=Crassostrea virginica TaxID=6565 RepID=A0A8B8AHW3_CRAVI|nr:8-oxo-dGDP phosphatase NUDT18-like isoform X2 [Crassostrea virginica]